jgi:MinD-like ATPase involved in chromosome partitioning or flagellar assembly
MSRARSSASRGRPLSGLRIGVFGKGGAGKSTVAVLLARALRARGYSVLVLDADSTNVGLESNDLEPAAARLAEWLEEASRGESAPATRRSS